ncbi:hypothetical protein ABT404_08950 [Streptomyces hyaluromycini]|uniref:Uncharacterized protein n=1 Tax=Streptomyces hyaluromycini TaxID=1377993 RepID=A0ABV1WRV8_9ACTN
MLAPIRRTAEFVRVAYHFDTARVVPVDVAVLADTWTVTAGPLRLRFTTGPRTLLGHLPHAVRARSPAARRGTACGICGRSANCRAPATAWTWARSHRSNPPVRFGFGSVPR